MAATRGAGAPRAVAANGRSYRDGGAQTAAAPPTISEISWVIAACRALL